MTPLHECTHETEAQELRAQVDTMKQRIDALERQLAGEKKRAIGRTTERKKPTPSTNVRPKNDAAAQEKRAENRAARDKQLDTELVSHVIPEAERTTCTGCGGVAFVELAPDISTEYEWRPGRLVRLLHRRETRCCEQ